MARRQRKHSGAPKWSSRAGVFIGTLVLIAGIFASVPGSASATSAALVLAFGPSAVASTGGTQLWASRYNGPGNGNDESTSVAISPDGSKVFVTGPSRTGSLTFFDYATVAYEASTGVRLWVARYNGPANAPDIAVKVVASPDGSKVFVTGRSPGVTTSLDYATVAYDSTTGAQLWVRRYNGPGNGYDRAFSLVASPDGSKVFVTGSSPGVTTSEDYATVAYDSTTGAQLWVRRYNGPGNGTDIASSVASSPDGSKVFVTGGSVGTTTGYDYATVAYGAVTGNRLWVRRYNGPGTGIVDIAFSLASSPDGSRVFVTGESFTSMTGYDYATVAYDASSGTKLWVRRYNSPANGYDLPFSMATSPDGSKVYVTGVSDGVTTSFDYATVAYDSTTGTQIWVSRYNGPNNSVDYAQSTAVSPDGSKIFVTGQSDGGLTYSDYATVAYDSTTGTQLWASRYNGPRGASEDQAYALVVSPDGSRVYVAGYSQASTRTYDYATVAYSA